MPARHPQRGKYGFTVVELIVTIAVIALLAAIVVPRFVAPDSFRTRGFYDTSKSIVRFAQKTAIAWRKEVFVCVTAASVSAGTAAGCATPIVNPVTGDNLSANAPAGVTLTPAAFSFDGAGRPNPNVAVTITLTSTLPDDPVRLIIVERETGYVHP